ILPSAAALSGLLDFFIGSAFLTAFVVYYRIPVGWNLLLWPFLVVLLVALTLGVGMFLAALNVRFRDVKYAIPFGIQLWLFVSPIIYPASMVPERYRWLLALNPLSGLIEGFRYALVPTQPLHWNLLGISAVITALLFVAGLAYFRRTERFFADII